MNKTDTIGIDVAKYVFHVRIQDRQGHNSCRSVFPVIRR